MLPNIFIFLAKVKKNVMCMKIEKKMLFRRKKFTTGIRSIKWKFPRVFNEISMFLFSSLFLVIKHYLINLVHLFRQWDKQCAMQLPYFSAYFLTCIQTSHMACSKCVECILNFFLLHASVSAVAKIKFHTEWISQHSVNSNEVTDGFKAKIISPSRRHCELHLSSRSENTDHSR